MPSFSRSFAAPVQSIPTHPRYDPGHNAPTAPARVVPSIIAQPPRLAYPSAAYSSTAPPPTGPDSEGVFHIAQPWPCAHSHPPPSSLPPSPPEPTAVGATSLVTLAFQDPGLEQAYRSRVVREHGGNEGVMFNGAVVIIFIAIIASEVVKVDNSGGVTFGKVGPCVQIWPSIIPLLMACFGMLSHFPVGRTGDPALEHQLVVRVGTAVMFIGNLTWNLLWRLDSTPLQCLQDGGNATLPWGAATHPWGEASVTVPSLFAHVENAPIRLWPLWLAVVFVVVFKLHQLCFPFWMRVVIGSCLLVNVVAVPNLTGFDKSLENVCMSSVVLAAELVGRHFEKLERRRFVESWRLHKPFV